MTVRRGLIVLAVVGCGGRTPGPFGEPLPSPAATAELRDGEGRRVGIATFTAADTGAYLTLSVAGLSPGLHGIHVHETGTCTPPDFTSAGPHLNPADRQHGLEQPEGPHAGDLPNLEVQPDGSADASLRMPRPLFGPRPGSVLGPTPTALVIHAGPDDQRTDPDGNAGARVVCGVIRRR